jgi:hypothetical protein
VTTRLPPQCLACVHWISPFDRTDAGAHEPEPVQICAGFPLPAGIPDDIWWNRADHRQPHPGDHGVRWEPDGEAEFPEWALSS